MCVCVGEGVGGYILFSLCAKSDRRKKKIKPDVLIMVNNSGR